MSEIGELSTTDLPLRFWRHDAVGAEILDHLAIVIEAVSDKYPGHTQSCGCTFAKRILDGFEHALLVHAADRFMGISEGIFQELDDICLGGHGVGTVSTADVDRRVFADDGGPYDVWVGP